MADGLKTALLVGLVACGNAPEGPCSRYSRHSSVQAWCHVRAAGAVPPGELDAWCAVAAQHESACRMAWVEPRLHPSSGVTTPVLQAACRGEDACLLDVLDHRPETDPLAQSRRCLALSARHSGHCVRHTIQRWRSSRPSVAAWSAFVEGAAQLPDPGPAHVGFHLAEVAFCDRSLACDDLPQGMSEPCAEGMGPFVAGHERCSHAQAGVPR